jgi:serine kinase of HPr protein (carbohydrate metabolism regulator)
MSVKLKTLLPVLQAQPLTDKADVEVAGCYIADLLSDVLAHAKPDILWVTIQTHRNVVSVAAMKDVPVVLITCGRKPEPEIIREAEEEGVVLLTTPLSTYEAAGKLWEAGIR